MVIAALMRARSPLVASVGLSLAFGAWLIAAPAAAEGYPACAGKIQADELAAAKGVFQAGQVSFREADYPKAISLWEEAFRRDCTASKLLLNLATAYQLNGQPREALVALKTYTERVPNATDRAVIEKRIETLAQQLAAQAPEPTVRVVERASVEAQPTTPAAPDARERTAANGPAPATPAGEGGEPSRFGLPTVGQFVLFGAGGLAFAGGATWFFVEHKAYTDQHDALQAKCGGDVCKLDAAAQSEVEDVNATYERRTAAAVVGLTGAAVAAGAVVWYVVTGGNLEHDAAPEPRPSASATLLPTVTPGFLGLTAVGRY